jgi:methylase of polypeptide subunit release factors
MAGSGYYYARALWSESEHTEDMQSYLQTEEELVSVALSLGARSVEGWSPEESVLAKDSNRTPVDIAKSVRREIRMGGDPVGEAFCRLRSPEVRRKQGATYTPQSVVEAMVSWAAQSGLNPARVIDPGAGSGRFLLAGAKAFPSAELVGIEIDPLAAIIARGNLAAAGLAARTQIVLSDYRQAEIPAIAGKTLFIGNPPYVRHHELSVVAKQWLTAQARKLGFAASQLAGLHVHFFLATSLKAREHDFGTFITSAEWLDVNYGKLVRDLFLEDLGGQGITILEPTTKTFSDAATTSAITQFVIGSKPETIRIKRSKRVDSKDALTGGHWLNRGRLEAEKRWSHLTRKAKEVREGFVELGELCRVHRGQVTGANRVWIVGPHSVTLPESVLFASVTRAKELFAAGDTLADASKLKDVIDIPADLSIFDTEDRNIIDRFLENAKFLGADSGYVAKNRKAWWSVGLRSPAPILATYMARRTPAFVRNLAGARHINIAHGIYPRDPLPAKTLDFLAQFLSSGVSLKDGRMYAGGLTKFEPREMERILVPGPELMESMQNA